MIFKPLPTQSVSSDGHSFFLRVLGWRTSKICGRFYNRNCGRFQYRRYLVHVRLTSLRSHTHIEGKSSSLLFSEVVCSTKLDQVGKKFPMIINFICIEKLQNSLFVLPKSAATGVLIVVIRIHTIYVHSNVILSPRSAHTSEYVFQIVVSP